MRTVVHVDMDAFYASVETLRNPELRGKPVIVGGDPESQRGVVATCSYEARRFGVRSAMPMREAVKRCPHAIFLRPDMKTYERYSHRVHHVFESFTPLVEPISIDEAFLDLTGCEHFYDSLWEMGRKIKDQIAQSTGLTASVGIAPNKFLAKLASDAKKPDGLYVITPTQIDDFLLPLSVRRLPGVGPKGAEKLRLAGIETVADLRRRSLNNLQSLVGDRWGRFLYQLARGIDDRAVEPPSQSVSMSREVTFEEDIDDLATLKHVLAVQTADVGTRLRRAGLYAKSVFIKVRYGDYSTLTRRQTIASGIQDDDRLYEAASGLLDRLAPKRPVRLIGTGVTDLVKVRQVSLFEDPRKEQLSQVIDEINARFPHRVLKKGREWLPVDDQKPRAND